MVVMFMVLLVKEILVLVLLVVVVVVMEGVAVVEVLPLPRTELLNSLEAGETNLIVDVSSAVTEAMTKPAGNSKQSFGIKPL